MSTSLPVAFSPSGWTFTQGFLVGQATFIFLCLLFVRYVVFSPAEVDDGSDWRENRAERVKKSLLSTTAVPPPPPSSLLKKTGYDMSIHPAESADWLNVLFAQVLQGYRNDLLSSGGEEGARQRIESWLNPEGTKISWLDPIEVTTLNLGSSFPLLSNARIRPADGQGRVRAEIDVDYLDTLSLSISTSVLINFPRPRFAVLPVSIGVELASVGGTLSVQIHDPKDQRQHLHVCLLPDFHLNLKTTSLLGSRAKLQDIPKLEQLIVARLRAAIQDRFVFPHHISLALPRLLSPSIAPTPIVSEIGESTVNALAQAVTSSLDRIVQDFSTGAIPLSPADSSSSTDGQDAAASAESASAFMPEADLETQRLPITPMIQKQTKMSSDFPGYAASTSPSQSFRRASGSPENSVAPLINNPSRPSMSLASPSAVTTSHLGASIVGGDSGNFRFRGQFTSQATVPESETSHRAERRIGSLKSRAS